VDRQQIDIQRLRRWGQWLVLFALSIASLWAQKVGYVATDLIRQRFPEAQKVDQRIMQIAKEWKHQIERQRQEIRSLEEEIQKNRLIWSAAERKQKEQELAKKKQALEQEIERKFGVGGEFDQLVKKLMKPVEEKIAAAIKETAEARGYDIIWDKSQQPLLYTNPRYDITIEVMERLGINVEDLKAEFEKLLEKAPLKKERRRSVRPRRPPTKEERLKKEMEERQIQRDRDLMTEPKSPDNKSK